jgi:hypothetical protein
MSRRTRYWTLHWLRVTLWPLPVLTLFRVARATANAVCRQASGGPASDKKRGPSQPGPLASECTLATRHS